MMYDSVFKEGASEVLHLRDSSVISLYVNTSIIHELGVNTFEFHTFFPFDQILLKLDISQI